MTVRQYTTLRHPLQPDRTDRTFRGYRIRHNPIMDFWWIERDGHQIATARDASDAERLIRKLTD